MLEGNVVELRILLIHDVIISAEDREGSIQLYVSSYTAIHNTDDTALYNRIGNNAI